MYNGKFGELKAKELWQGLTMTESGGIDDRNGIDGYLYGKKIQVKYDGTISKTGNIYVELYEKSAGHIDQDWRASKIAADSYIFITSGEAYLISVNAIAEAVKSLSNDNALKCRAISETSIGFLIPLNKISVSEKKHYKL